MATATTNPNRCDCLSQAIAALRKTDDDLSIGFAWNTRTGGEYVNVSLYRPSGSRKRIPVSMSAKFCPFCGVRYEPESAEKGGTE